MSIKVSFFLAKSRASSSRLLYSLSWADGRLLARYSSSLDAKTPDASSVGPKLGCGIGGEKGGWDKVKRLGRGCKGPVNNKALSLEFRFFNAVLRAITGPSPKRAAPPARERRDQIRISGATQKSEYGNFSPA